MNLSKKAKYNTEAIKIQTEQLHKYETWIDFN